MAEKTSSPSRRRAEKAVGDLAYRGQDLAEQCQRSVVDAAHKVQDSVKAHPVLATIGLAATVGAIVGVVFYKNHKHR